MAHDEDGEIARTLYSGFLMYLSLYSALFLGSLATSLGGVSYLGIARHATIPVGAVFIVVNILYSIFLMHSIHTWTAAGRHKSAFPFKRLSNLGSSLLLTGCLTISIVIIACGLYTNAIVSFGQGVFFTWIGLIASFGVGLYYLYDTKKRLSAMAGANVVPPFTLFQRMLIPVLSVVSILFVLLATGSYALNSKKFYNMYAKEIAASVQVKSQFLATIYGAVSSQLNVLANTDEIRTGNQAGIYAMLHRMHPVRNEYINDYFYAGTDGLTISSDSPDRVDIQDRPYFREALATGSIVFSDPVVSRLDGRLIIIIANPVKVAGTINGVISCSMSVSNLDRVLGKDTITKTGRFILLTKDGTVVYHRKAEYIGTRVGVDITDDGKQISGIMNIISAASGSFLRYVFDGKEAISYKVELPERGYILLFTLDAEDFVSPLDSTILQTILFFFLLIALIFLVIAHATRSFSGTITDRKTAEALLLESEEKYKSLFKNMTSGFAFHEVIVDESNVPVDYRYIDVNPAFERLVGLKASDILGKRIKSVRAEYDEYWIKKFGKVAMDGEPCMYEHYDGTSGQYFETSVYSPKKGFFAVVFNDITERKKAEAEIMELNAHLEDMVKERTKQLSDANHDLKASNSQLDRTIAELRNTQSQLIISEKMAILGQLAAGVAHEINTPLGAILSSANALLRSSFNDSVQMFRYYSTLEPETADLFDRIHSRCSLDFDPGSLVETAEKRERKNTLQATLTGEGIPDSPKAARLLVEIGIRDELDLVLPLLRKAGGMEALEAIQKLLVTPRSAWIIQTAAKKAAAVISALRTYSHHDVTGGMVKTDLREDMETILTLYYHKMKLGVKIVRRYCDAPVIMCYPEEISQVWVNILNNALYAMNHKGVIEIEIKREEEGYSISISDDGPQIPPEIQGRIFEPFFTTKKPGEGSGLGLDIVKRIVKRHGGTIGFTSVPEKTVFTVLLPVRSI